MSTTVRLNDGREMPLLGLGTWKMSDEDAPALVRTAIDAGYRLIDTAALYRNERGVGRGVAGAEGVWITTKVWNSEHGAAKTRHAAKDSLDRLGVEAIDLYLIHWPAPRADLYVETWETLIEMREKRLLRSIGVSNFTIDHLERIGRETGVVPAVNQIELHPAFQQRELAAYHREKGIVTQSWSPLGQGALLRSAEIVQLAERRGCSPAQLIIAWHLEQGYSVIPKSGDPERMRANFAAAQIRLDEEEITAIAALDDPNGRTGFDPMQFE